MSADLPSLKGEWRVTRRIFGEESRFRGRVLIDDAGRYSEKGLVYTPHYQGDAHRHYLYHQAANRLRISFPDGREFLNLQFKDGEARGQHICGDDIYDARFRIRGDTWVTSYRVKGPRKDYRIVSVMTRKTFGHQVA